MLTVAALPVAVFDISASTEAAFQTKNDATNSDLMSNIGSKLEMSTIWFIT